MNDDASGRGVPKDLTQAYIWYAIATAKSRMEKLEPNLTQQQIAAAERLAAEWLEAHNKGLKIFRAANVCFGSKADALPCWIGRVKRVRF